MKKILRLFVSLCITMMLLAPVSLAYDYREDALRDQEYFHSVSALEEMALDALASMDSSGMDQINSLDYDCAVRVYVFESAEFLDALKSGFSAEMKTHDNYVWKIPAAVDNGGYAYVVVRGMEDEGFGYTAFVGDYGATDDLPLSYIYHAEAVNALLADAVFDSVYITSVPVWNIDLVTVVSGESVRFIPYAARPDLVGVENGEIYSEGELEEILKAYAAETTFVRPAAILFLIVVVIGCAAILTALLYKRGRNRRK